MIKDILNTKSSGHVASGKFSISSVNTCWRKKYLELKGLYKEEFGEELLRLFNIGNVIHREMTRELVEKEGKGFYLVASEVNIPTHKYISGRMDNIISVNGENIIVDVKSAGDWTMKSLAKGKDCDQSYKDQVLLYMYLSNIHKGMLLFVGKNKGELEEVEVVYNEDRAKRLVQEIEDFFINYIEKNIEPPKCINPQWPCKCCENESNFDISKGGIE